jgi:hypothetical protein
MTIKDIKDYREAMDKVKDEKRVMVRLRRASNNQTWYVVLKKD